MPDLLTGEDRDEANIPEYISGQTETEVTHTEMVDEQCDTWNQFSWWTLTIGTTLCVSSSWVKFVSLLMYL